MIWVRREQAMVSASWKWLTSMEQQCPVILQAGMYAAIVLACPDTGVVIAEVSTKRKGRRVQEAYSSWENTAKLNSSSCLHLPLDTGSAVCRKDSAAEDQNVSYSPPQALNMAFLLASTVLPLTL
jgi:hypothetical protein